MRLFRVCFVVIVGLMASGCVTPMTLEQQSPEPDYLHTRKIVISVVDEREIVEQGKPETFIGTAEDAFGTVITLMTYPWFVSDEGQQTQTLSNAIEERIVFGLNNKGWDAVPASLSASPSERETEEVLNSLDAANLLVLTLKKWNVNLHLNWITDLIFDWDVVVTVLDDSGRTLVSFEESGSDIIEKKVARTGADHIRLAYRERLKRILESRNVQAALGESDEAQMALQEPSDTQIPPQDVDVAENSYSVETDESNGGSNRNLAAQIRALQILMDSGTISQQEYIDLVRRVVDTEDAKSD